MSLLTLLAALDKAHARLEGEIARGGLDIVDRHLTREDAIKAVLTWYRTNYGDSDS